MYENLVKRLRYCSEERDGCGMCALSSYCVLRVGLLTQAADAIEALRKADPDKPRSERIRTTQNQNTISRWKEPGPGGMWSRYLVQDPKTKGGVVIVLQDEDQHGVLDTDLLDIVRDRLECTTTKDYVHTMALDHINIALDWLHALARRVPEPPKEEARCTS